MGTVETLRSLSLRPLPPDELVSMNSLSSPDSFEPAAAFLDWVRQSYLEEDGALFWPGHRHLRDASIGILWTTAEATRRGQRVLAQAEIPGQGRKSQWSQARAQQQIRGFFGHIPDFLLTFDAVYAQQADDATFCALVDHELCHCAQAEDEFGQPKFNQATGKPVWTLKPHDVEEFVSVVARFGVQAAGEAATDFVIAASQQPQIGPAKLAQGCGICLMRAA